MKADDLGVIRPCCCGSEDRPCRRLTRHNNETQEDLYVAVAVLLVSNALFVRTLLASRNVVIAAGSW